MIQNAITALKGQDFDAYIELARKVVGTPTEEVFWEELAAKHPEDLDFLDVVCAWPRNKVFSSNRVLAPVLAKLKKFSAADFEKLVRFVASTDEAYYFIPILIERVTQLPRLAIEYAASLADSSRENIKAQRVWADSFVKGAPTEAAEFVLCNFQADSRLSTPVRLVLMSFDESALANHAGLSSVAAQIVDSVLLPSELDEDSWLVVVKLVKASGYASDVLMSAVDSHDLAAVNALAGMLTRVRELEFGINKLPLGEVILRLVKGGAADKAARAYADNVLAMLMHDGKTHKVAMDFLTLLGGQEQNGVKLFQAAFNSAFSNEAEFAHLLTKWLLSPAANTKAISTLLSMYSNGNTAPQLDEALILSADDNSLNRVARRILALSFNEVTMCSFAAHFMEIDGLGTRGLALGEQLLVEIYKEYPRGTERFISEKIKTLDKKKPSKKVYQHVHAAILKWQARFEALPKISELAPTDRERYVVRQVNVRWHRDIQNDAHKKSIFASIFANRSIIIQGNRFAAFGEFGPPVVTQMEGLEHSIELPVSEFADPMGGEMRRFKLLEE